MVFRVIISYSISIRCLQSKVIVAEQTEKDIDATRSQYIPVAVRTQILFFCTYDLAMIDPMYQYSLDWFIRIFLNGIMNAEQAGKKQIYKLILYFFLL